jgi:hypothetical protein
VTGLAAAPAIAASTATQVLPSVATVVAAIVGALITGFGAASLKHKWDSEADETAWRRDREARVRAQLLSAFAQYLAARPDLRAVRTLADKPDDAAGVVSAARLAAANLLILLPEPEQRAVVDDDLRTLEKWVASWLRPSSAVDRTDVPPAEPILDLARGLAVEPAREPAA